MNEQIKKEAEEVYIVFADSIKMGLSDNNQPVACFKYKEHAYKWASDMYGKFYIIVKTTASISYLIGIPDSDGGL